MARIEELGAGEATGRVSFVGLRSPVDPSTWGPLAGLPATIAGSLGWSCR